MKPKSSPACESVMFWGFTVLGIIALVLYATSCAGPYRGPDAIPDRLRVGYSETEFDTLEEFIPGEAYSVSLEWDLQPPPLPSETDAARNELLRQILAAPSPDAPDGNDGILEQIERHWVTVMLLLVALAGAGALPLLVKRLVPGVDEKK